MAFDAGEAGWCSRTSAAVATRIIIFITTKLNEAADVRNGSKADIPTTLNWR
jgi:hypothetical protein